MIRNKRLLLEMHNIHVTYDNIKALNGVDFNVYAGEIHAITGEHRAGKSTLIKLLGGAVRKREGEILYKGERIPFFSPKTAIEKKIGVLYQTLQLIPTANTVENMFLGRMLYTRFGFPDRRRMAAEARAILKTLNLDINVNLPIESLQQGTQHMIELARLLSIDPDLIIFDELSNKLTPDEIKKVYKILFDYRKRGKAIIYISHNMDEILQLSDRVTILKGGYRLGTEKTTDLNKPRLIQLAYSYAPDQERIEEKADKFLLIRGYIESILQNLPIGVLITDETGEIQLFNYTAMDILGLDHTRIKNRDIRTLLERICSPIADEMVATIASKDTGEWEDIEIEGDKVLSFYIFPFKDQNFDYLGTTILIRDVLLDRALKDYLIQSEKMASVAEVAVGVAHEINNPLYIIKNYIELIRRQRLDSRAETRLEKIEKELERIVQIVNSLLSFSRIKHSPAQGFDINLLIRETVILLDYQIQKKAIGVDFDFRHPAIIINAIENRIKQVVINLVSNSIEALLENGSILITTDFIEETGEALISVQDNGNGIPEDVRANIFSPFFSTKIHKNNTGLGLSICRHIIEEHGGRIACESIPSEFTRFDVYLPDAAVSASAEA